MTYLINNCPNLDLNKISNEGQTPLHIAIESLNFNMIKFLISHKASLNTRDCKGRTPQDLLIERKLDYLIKVQEAETSTEEPSKKVWTVNISIHNIEDESLEGMFKGIRTYFDKKLSPKMDNNNSVLEPPSSVASSSFIGSEGHEETKYYKGESRPKATTDLGQPDMLSCTVSNAPTHRQRRYNIKGMGKAAAEKKKHEKIGPKSFSVIKLLGTGSFGEVFLVEK